MSWKQKEARRARRAAQPDNVQRRLAVTRDTTGTVPVVHGMNAVYSTPVVWAVVCDRTKDARHSFDQALHQATLIEITAGHGPLCVGKHHLEMVPFADTAQAAVQSYDEWVRA